MVKTHYNFGILELVRECPRFGLMLVSMCLSIVFIPLDVISVTGALRSAMPLGINPFWKVCSPSVSTGGILIPLISSADWSRILQLCFMFKCLCDTVILDDFKTALDKLSARWLARQGIHEFHTLGRHLFTLPPIPFMRPCLDVSSILRFQKPPDLH